MKKKSNNLNHEIELTLNKESIYKIEQIFHISRMFREVTKYTVFASFLYLLFSFAVMDRDLKVFGESGLKIYVDLYDHFDEDLEICVYPSDDKSADVCEVVSMLDYEFEPATIGPFKFDSDEIEE